MTAYNNEEEFPKQVRIETPNTYIDSVIKGTGNVIERSARNVLVNGDNNYIGEETSNINIFNSSGCTVSSGVIGTTLINSSGIVVRTDNKVYINNQELITGGLSSSAYTILTASTTYFMDTDNGTVELRGTTTHDTHLPLALGHHQKFIVKNNSYAGVVQNVKPADGSSDSIDLQVLWVLGYLDSITVQSDGISNYIIV